MRYFIKIDLSGIQSFIFDVPSKGAAKQLKARSVYVQAITEIAQKFFEEKLDSLKVVYNGGGNLFFYADASEEVLKKAIQKFQEDFQQENIFPIIAYLASEGDFTTDMQHIAKEANKAKLQKPLAIQAYVYRPFKEDIWKSFTEELIKSKGFVIRQATQKEDSPSPFSKAGFYFQTSSDASQFEGKILNKLPVKKQGIADFDEIVQQSTGDQKLAALKIDVDNLGLLFRNKTREEYEQNSQYLSQFFEAEMYQILKPYIDEASIYPVFAGGDDCFLIGAWDKVLEAACVIQKEFHAFQTEEKLNLSISAGVVIVPANFPMVRLAEEAEHALELAKNHGKNKITLFGEVLTWQDYQKAKEIAKELKKLIEEHNASRAVLHRIKSSEIGFTRLQEQAQTGKLNFPKVHRLKYYLRNFGDNQVRECMEKLFKEYEDALLQTFMRKEKALNPMVFPVAARWAELFTKSTKEQEESINS
jgi:CRISPR-associated protein Csm1